MWPLIRASGLHLGCVHHLFSHVCPFGVPRTALSLVRRCFRPRFSILLPSVLPGLLRTCPLPSAGTAQWVNRPRAAANFCRGPSLPRARFFSCPRCRTARRCSPARSSAAPIVSSRVAPSGTPWDLATDSVSSGAGSLFSGQAHVFTGQASIVSGKALVSPRQASIF
jgi:hypothetical protein